MNPAEIKLDMFRKIDSIKESELEKIYSKFLTLLKTATTYKLSDSEKAPIEEALEASKNERTYSSDEVMKKQGKDIPI